MSVELKFNIPMHVNHVNFVSSLQINIENADKVNKINKAFSEIQKEVQQLSKGPVLEPQKNNQVISVCKNLRGEMKGGMCSKHYILALKLQAILAVALQL